MNKNAKHFDNFIKEYNALSRKLPRMYGIEAKNLFKENFDKEGFIAGNERLQKWKPTKEKSGRKILTKTRTLRKGIQIKRITSKSVTIGVDGNIKYAAIHNFGGTIKGSFTIDEHQRKFRGKEVTVKQHTRNVNTKIPQRRFIGYSPALKKRLDRRFDKEMEKIINKYRL